MIQNSPPQTYCLDGNTGSMALPYKWLYSLQEGWLLCVDGQIFEIVAMVLGKSLPGKNPKTPHAVLEGAKGKRGSLYLKGHRLAITRGRTSTAVVHATIVSKGGRDSDLIKVVDAETLAAREHEAMLAKLAVGTGLVVNARGYTVIGNDQAPVKPRSKVTQRQVYLRANDGSLHTLLRDGASLVLRSGSGKRPKPVRGLKVHAGK